MPDFVVFPRDEGMSKSYLSRWDPYAEILSSIPTLPVLDGFFPDADFGRPALLVFLKKEPPFSASFFIFSVLHLSYRSPLPFFQTLFMIFSINGSMVFRY